MNPTPHGGDVQTYCERYGRAPLDFSANTNPLGMSPLAKSAAARALDTADRYPDPHCRALRGALAAHEGVDAGHILCGNGAADLIYRLALAAGPKTALLPAPTFSEYGQALALAGCRIEHHPLPANQGFILTESLLGSISPVLDILFLCEPNNPTGLAVPVSLLRRIAGRCAETGTLLVMDECFNGFLPDPEGHSLKPLLPGMPNLVILKAFTKLYGMAGLRLGYLLCSDTALLAGVAAAGQPWAVSAPAQAAGAAALEDTAYLRQTQQLIAAERPRLAAGLAAAGARVWPSRANYLFFKANPALGEQLAEQGILIRDCRGYRGLGPGYYRVAVRTAAENDRLLAALGVA